ncbi:MAG: hypothetical protein ACKVP0_13665 [Pirellulaceae bacterium]
MDAKPLDKLTTEDLARYPVWQFDNENETIHGRDETWVVPFVDLPVDTLSNRIVAVKLHVGRREFVGMLSNIDLDDLRATQEFAALSVYHRRSWFHLLRYFDIGYEQSGPRQLAEFIGVPFEEVFPIPYDISTVAVGHPKVVRGRINAEPEIRLSENERLDLIFERLRHGY